MRKHLEGKCCHCLFNVCCYIVYAWHCGIGNVECHGLPYFAAWERKKILQLIFKLNFPKYHVTIARSYCMIVLPIIKIISCYILALVVLQRKLLPRRQLCAPNT